MQLLFFWVGGLSNNDAISRNTVFAATECFAFDTTDISTVSCVSLSVRIFFWNCFLLFMMCSFIHQLQPDSIVVMLSHLENIYFFFFFQPTGGIHCSLLTTVTPWGESISFLVGCFSLFVCLLFYPWQDLAMKKHTFLSSTIQ